MDQHWVVSDSVNSLFFFFLRSPETLLLLIITMLAGGGGMRGHVSSGRNKGCWLSGSFLSFDLTSNPHTK